ncbi:cupin domain-containing protein [Candidatus Electronema sp. JM]|uniref:cupin domain-containing protein n=1 Tax=Candidatus Electronema sp. JM TaxID=3401571 RepID=UPI003AA91C45
MTGNIFTSLPKKSATEVFDILLQNKNIKIERIVSQGHTSPAEGWYDQDGNEWVLVLEGDGAIFFEDGRQVMLNKGDFLHIPAHEKHKVSWTDLGKQTVWLAVHYPS